MISIITCGIQPVLLENLSENIATTIGVEFEFLPFDNRVPHWGLCKVYNYMVTKAQGEIICFIHDDVIFKSQDWGMKIMEVFERIENVGLIGLAGSGYKTITTSTWSAAPVELAIANVFEHKKFRRETSGNIGFTGNGKAIQQVVNLDGFFLATKKEIAQKNPFDENLLTGFHAYDTDFSLKIGSNFNLFVLSDIEVEHLSDGNTDLNWLLDSERISIKWRKSLPRSTVKLGYLEQERQEYRAYCKGLSIISNHKPFNRWFFISWSVKNFRISYILVVLFKKQIDKALKRLL